VNNKLERDVEC